MSKHIFFVLCCLYFGTQGSVTSQGVPSLNLIAQLKNNLIRLNSSTKLDTPATGPVINLDHTSSVIKERIFELQQLREKSEKQKQQSELDGVIEKIKNRHFTEAEIILRKLNLSYRIPEIVKSVSNSSNDNFHLLLDFGSELTTVDLSFGVLFAAWDQMEVSGKRDVFDVIDLVNAIKTRLLVLNPSLEWKAKAGIITNETLSEISSASVEILKSAMISGNYQNNSHVHKLADSISAIGLIDIWEDVIQKVVSQSFGNVSATSIAESLKSHKFQSQVIAGLQALFKQLENTDNLDNPAVLKISEYLKQLTHKSNYDKLAMEKKDAVEIMINKLPLCARNLFFEPFVCIWNRDKSEYLYVAGAEFNRNEDKRSVFTRTTGEVVGPGVWMAEKLGDEFFFRSKAYEREYLFAASGLHDKNNRFVHTWTEGGKVGNKSSWSIELHGDDCFLRNVHYGEYLLASDLQSGNMSRYVFTSIPKSSIREMENFRWQLRACDLSEILRKGV